MWAHGGVGCMRAAWCGRAQWDLTRRSLNRDNNVNLEGEKKGVNMFVLVFLFFSFLFF